MTVLRQTSFLALMIAAQTLFFSSASEAATKTCKLEISGNDAMQFDKKELAAAAECTEVELTLKHTGKLPAQAMGHNWALVRTGDFAAVTTAAMKAGLANNYLPPGDKRVLAATKIIGGGETTSVKFSTSLLKKGESYTFVCTFPGHSTLMKGTFKFG